MQAHDIRVFVIRGNHDSKANNITSELALPDNVHVFDGRGSSIRLNDCPVAIHGVSFASPSAPTSLLPKYWDAVADCISIGLLHTSLAGDGAHDTYAPCSLEQLIGCTNAIRHWSAFDAPDRPTMSLNKGGTTSAPRQPHLHRSCLPVSMKQQVIS